MLTKTTTALATVALAGLLTPLAADAGLVDGPVADSDRVEAQSSMTYTLVFRGGEPAAIAVSGDKDTDLDLKVYDMNDNLIASDTDLTDQCIVSWVPGSTRKYRVVIENLGNVWNGYNMIAN